MLLLLVSGRIYIYITFISRVGYFTPVKPMLFSSIYRAPIGVKLASTWWMLFEVNLSPGQTSWWANPHGIESTFIQFLLTIYRGHEIWHRAPNNAKLGTNQPIHQKYHRFAWSLIPSPKTNVCLFSSLTTSPTKICPKHSPSPTFASRHPSRALVRMKRVPQGWGTMSWRSSTYPPYVVHPETK